jgi:hypothetical protein
MSASPAKAFRDPIESDRDSRFLFLRVFFTRTGIHFAGKRSEAFRDPVRSRGRRGMMLLEALAALALAGLLTSLIVQMSGLASVAARAPGAKLDAVALAGDLLDDAAANRLKTPSGLREGLPYRISITQLALTPLKSPGAPAPADLPRTGKEQVAPIVQVERIEARVGSVRQETARVSHAP